MLKKFKCVEGCSDCCVKRVYYPSKEFGKIGVLLLPNEKRRIEQLAEAKKMKVKLLPRIGVSRDDECAGPEDIIFYQLMGKERDGNFCPFLESEGSERAPHGGARCTIYDERPEACKAYPLISIDPTISTLDSKCTFCISSGEDKVCNLGLGNEIKALNKITVATRTDEGTQLWRYATDVGEPDDEKTLLPEGWFKIQTA